MSKRKKLWYGITALLMIVCNGGAVYAAIYRKDWQWAAIGVVALVGVTVSYGGIFIGAVMAERAERKD